MSNSDTWGNYAHKNKRLGWGDTNQADKDWHDQEQRRAEERARQEREWEQQQREATEQRRREDERRRLQ